jgi:uncharacterized membrane protein YfcA
MRLTKEGRSFLTSHSQPTQFVMFTISAIVGSAILYQDFADMDAHRLINFLFGCMTTFAGVYFLTRHKDDDDSESAKGRAAGTATAETGGVGEGVEGSDRVGSRQGEERLARPMAMGAKSSRGSRAVTTGSVPTIANLQGHSTHSLSVV